MTEHILRQSCYSVGLALGLVALVAGFTGHISLPLLLAAMLYIITTTLAEMRKGE